MALSTDNGDDCVPIIMDYVIVSVCLSVWGKAGITVHRMIWKLMNLWGYTYRRFGKSMFSTLYVGK